MESIELHTVQELDLSNELLDSAIQLFSALSNEDAIKIFRYLRNDVVSSTQAIQELGLTQKRYYSRLKTLIDVGLVEKTGGGYHYTALGDAVYKLWIFVMRVLDNKERFKLINELNKNKSLPSSEMDQLKNMIIKQSGVLGEAINLIQDSRKIDKVESLPTYEHLVDKLIEQVNLSEHHIFLASRYFETQVIDATLKANKRGVTLRVLMANENLSGKLNMLRLLLSPKLLKSLLDFTQSSVEDAVRETDLDYSFCVIDNRCCFFEFPSLEESKFSIAFYVSDEKINKKFTELFQLQWEKGESKKMPNFFTKLKGSEGKHADE